MPPYFYCIGGYMRKFNDKEYSDKCDEILNFIENHKINDKNNRLIQSMLWECSDKNTYIKHINELITSINSLKYADIMEPHSTRLLNYLTVLYNVYYNLYQEYKVVMFISGFKPASNNSIVYDCFRYQSAIEYLLKENIKDEIYESDKSKWENILKYMRKMDTKIELNLLNIKDENEFNKFCDKLKIDMNKLGITDEILKKYEYNDFYLNISGYEVLQPYLQVIKKYIEYTAKD